MISSWGSPSLALLCFELLSSSASTGCFLQVCLLLNMHRMVEPCSALFCVSCQSKFWAWLSRDQQCSSLDWANINYNQEGGMFQSSWLGCSLVQLGWTSPTMDMNREEIGGGSSRKLWCSSRRQNGKEKGWWQSVPCRSCLSCTDMVWLLRTRGIILILV